MSKLLEIPGLTWALVLYLITLFTGGTEALNKVVFTIPLFSGENMLLTLNGVIVIIGLVLLFFEVLKSTRVSTSTILDHMLSTLVFIAYLVIFITVKGAANQFFLLLTLMALFDVMAGFTITIAGAKRDINLGGGVVE